MRIKKTISLGLTLALALSMITPALAAPAPARTDTSKVVCAANGRSPFSDVPSTHWGFNGILTAYEDGVMTGTYYNQNTGERQFSPAAPLTMAEWSVMIYRAWYADEPFAVPEENWWGRQAEVLSRHGIYSDIGTLSSIQFNGPASRTQMAVTIANLMRDKGITADAAKVEAAKSQIADISDIFPMHQNAVATCWALGIINGTGGGKFDGNGKTERAAAATVYGRVKNVLAGASSGSETPPETPTPPANASLVGTLSSTRLNLRADAIKTHAPITDAWSQQSMEIRNISDRDSFNAACQTIKDSKMIMTQGEINYLGRNVYSITPWWQKSLMQHKRMWMAPWRHCVVTAETMGFKGMAIGFTQPDHCARPLLPLPSLLQPSPKSMPTQTRRTARRGSSALRLSAKEWITKWRGAPAGKMTSRLEIAIATHGH